VIGAGHNLDVPRRNAVHFVLKQPGHRNIRSISSGKTTCPFTATPKPPRDFIHSTTPDMATHHIASMLPPAWGHTISYSHLAVQLLNKDPNLVVTIMQHNLMGD
jgi:hypothetical protein